MRSASTSDSGSVAYLLQRRVNLTQSVETWKHGVNSVTIGGRVGERVGTGGLRSEGGVREDGGLEGNNGALGVGNESTELVVAIEEGGDELLVVEGVEGDAPPIHFNGDPVGIVQGQISHVSDETFTGFLDLSSESNVNSIARHKACA